MQLTAKLIQLLPLQTGTGKNGNWKKQDIIVETEEQFPKKICISIWNERVDISKLEIGKEYIFHCNIESKEYKEKWYTAVILWKTEEASLFVNVNVAPSPNKTSYKKTDNTGVAQGDSTAPPELNASFLKYIDEAEAFSKGPDFEEERGGLNEPDFNL